MMAIVHITNVINIYLLAIWPKATLRTSSYCGNVEINLISHLYHDIMCCCPCNFLLLTHRVLHSHCTLVSSAYSVVAKERSEPETYATF